MLTFSWRSDRERKTNQELNSLVFMTPLRKAFNLFSVNYGQQFERRNIKDCIDTELMKIHYQIHCIL